VTRITAAMQQARFLAGEQLLQQGKRGQRGADLIFEVGS
jgi:hypothetical protein